MIYYQNKEVRFDDYNIDKSEILKILNQIKSDGEMKNRIYVGQFTISFLFKILDLQPNTFPLPFHIILYEKVGGNEEVFIPERGDARFKDQSWIPFIHGYNFDLDKLAEVIVHCHRLNKMAVFI